MKRLRYTLLLLVVVLVLFFNIERLDINEQEVVNLHTFVYLYAAIALAGVLLHGPIWRAPLPYALTLALGGYLLLRLLVFRADPLVGGVSTYITVTELTFIAILVALGHRLAGHLREFEEAVATITFGESYRPVPRMEEAWEDIQLELARSRRYKSPLSVLVVTPEPDSLQAHLHRSVEEVQRTMVQRYAQASIARVISMVLRRTDLVIEQQERGRFIILSPETSGEGSDVVMERVRRAVAEHLGMRMRFGAATFPEDALTFEELLKRAEAQITPPKEP